MNISRKNYEVFFLDYHEGNLNEGQQREVLGFVESHPDLKDEFENFGIISLMKEPAIRFSGKEELKKSVVHAYNYKTWLLAYEENDLGEKDRNEVERFLEVNPEYRPELELLKQTRILPDYAIRFRNKSSLRKGGIVIPLWVRFAAAACLLLGLMSYWMIQQKPEEQLVDTHQQETPVSIPLNDPVAEKTKTNVIEQGKDLEKIKLTANVPKTVKKKELENKTEINLAVSDPIPATEKGESPVKQTMAPQTLFVINENKARSEDQNSKLVVLDDNDLTELGLKEKTEPESNSLLADAVNGAGKIFGFRAHYDKERNLLQSKYKETLALGPLAITRTVSR